MVYVVEPYYWKTLANMADKRFNIVPIIHFGTPDRYRMLINMVDVLFAAPNLPEQVLFFIIIIKSIYYEVVLIIFYLF